MLSPHQRTGPFLLVTRKPHSILGRSRISVRTIIQVLSHTAGKAISVSDIRHARPETRLSSGAQPPKKFPLCQTFEPRTKMNKRATTVYPTEPVDGIQILSITYAGDNITDEQVLKRFFKSIRKHAEIEINDRTLDWEPMNPYATSFYPRREFIIEYLDSRQGRSYIKRRSMTGEQGMSLDFSWEIFSATWGDVPGLNKRTLTKSPGVFQSMFDALDKDTWMFATCGNIQFDPAPGRLKVLQITYGCHGGPIHKVAVPEHQIFRAKYRWDQKFIEKRASFIAPEMKHVPRPVESRPSLKENRRISWRADRPLSWASAKPMLLKTA